MQYSQHSVPWASHSEATTDDLDRRQPHRAATSPPTSTTSSLINQYRGQPPYPTSLYPGQRPPQTIHQPDIYFSSGMNHTRYDPLYPPYPRNNHFSTNAAQFYPAHQQQYYGVQQVRSSSPAPPIPVPPKPPALQQEARQDSRRGPLHPAMYRSFTSPPPVPPKPSLLFEPETAAIPTSAYLDSSSSPPPATTTSSASPPIPPSLVSGAPVIETSNTETREEDDGDELAVALALSKDESMREEERLQELARLEEEELERALAASMLTSRVGYDLYESQPGAGPSNWASLPTQSPHSASVANTPTEVGPSASSSSTSNVKSDDTLPDPSAKVGSPDQKPKLDERLSQAAGTEPTMETANAPSPRTTKRLTVDTNTPVEPSQPNNDEELPRYSPTAADRTPTATAFPPEKTHSVPNTPPAASNNDGDLDDYDGDELPYLRGPGRDTPTNAASSVSAGPSSGPNKRSTMSPISASFIDLSYDDSYIDEDEALARRLAEEEEEEAAYREAQENENSKGGPSRNASAASTSATNACSDLPTYDAAVSISSVDGPSQASTAAPEVRVDTVPSPSAPNGKGSDLARNPSLNSVASDPMPNTSSSVVAFPSDGPQAITLQVDEPQRVIGRTSSMSAVPTSSRSPEVDDDLPPPLADDEGLSSTHMSSNPKAILLTASTTTIANNPIDGPGATSLGMLNANHFVDAELLHGVSINFTPPVISAKVSPMQGQMPTIISLPYGRCPPLHFQAPSWRHLLKLMARLSGTKMEPTIEAMAVNKNEVLKLRSVIQFIKPHHMSHEWRTILWFTIDHPVPPNIPNAHKYHPTNVNVLPWSYTLSSVPAMLRDASDTVLSKTYTIPATTFVPYPSLPITFPNLALYLQAALDDSRQQSESSPLRKLAKMVQTCYPNDCNINGTDEPDKSGGVSGLFKKVIGRGGKKGKKNGGGNEETYDLVTPFVPDEWG